MEWIMALVILGWLYDELTGRERPKRGTSDEELRRMDVLHGGFDG